MSWAIPRLSIPFTFFQNEKLENMIHFKFLMIQKQPLEVFCKKKVSLEISQNSQENTCARVSFLMKLQVSGLQLY